MPLNVAALGGPFTTDPTISLLNHLKGGWGTGSFRGGPNNFKISPNSFKGNYPSKDLIKYDTKYPNLGYQNMIIVKPDPVEIKWVDLGARRRYTDVKRVEVLAKGSDRYLRGFNMEQRIDALVNSNKLALKTSGIEHMKIGGFEEMSLAPSDKISLGIADSNRIYSSKALCELTYDKVIV